LGPLAPSPAWTLVTPYCKRTRPGRGMNTKVAGFPPLSRRSPAASLSPLRARPRARPIWAGAHGDTHSSAQGPPGLETPTIVTMMEVVIPFIFVEWAFLTKLPVLRPSVLVILSKMTHLLSCFINLLLKVDQPEHFLLFPLYLLIDCF
jgi:hypothetical protein